MDLKEFKEGIAFIAKATNQRRAEPEPFMVQVGVDGKISLLSGDERGTYIWRTGFSSELTSRREGIPSKPLVSAMKVLKGKLSLSLSVQANGLSLLTSAGGKIGIPFSSEAPTLFRLDKRINMGTMRVTPSQMGSCILAASGPEIGWDYVQVNKHGLIVTNERKFLKVNTSGIGWERSHSHRASFWEPLTSLRIDGELSFFESGVQVLAGNFEAYTGILEDRRVPDIHPYYYPQEGAIENRAVMDRKVLIGSLKSLDSIITMSNTNGMVSLVDNNGAQVGLTAKSTRGSSIIQFGSKMMTEMLSATDGKEVIVDWKDDASKPLMIKDASHQSQLFLLAPVLPRAA